MDDTDQSIYKQSFQSIDVPALISDENFVIQDVNAAGLNFTGYKRDEFIGETVSIVAGDDDTYTEIVETITNDEA